MPWILFATGAIFLVLTVHSHRPIRWPGPLVVPAWFVSWPVIELAPHWIVGQIAVATPLAALGGWQDWPGLAGLAATGLSVSLLRVHIGRARQTPDVLARALAEELGRDVAGGTERKGWPKLGRILPIRHPQVDRVADIRFHDRSGSGGHRRLTLDVYKPRYLGDDVRRPVLLYIHGGAWVIGNKKQQGLLTVNHLASLGWVCFSANYRLSPRATFPDHLIDVKRAIAWVKKHAAEHGGDPDFVVIAGGSAGAHLTSLAALTPNELEYQRDFPEVDTRVQGCIGYYGVYDFCDQHGHWPHRSFRMLLERAIMKTRFDGARESFEKASPVARVGEDAPPFFLLHGDLDNLSPPDESRRFAERLREVSREPVVYAELPGAQHAFELLPSIRSAAAVDAVGRFCQTIHNRNRERASRREA